MITKSEKLRNKLLLEYRQAAIDEKTYIFLKPNTLKSRRAQNKAYNLFKKGLKDEETKKSLIETINDENDFVRFVTAVYLSRFVPEEKIVSIRVLSEIEIKYSGLFGHSARLVINYIETGKML